MSEQKKIDVDLGGAFSERVLHKQLLELRRRMPNLTAQDMQKFAEIIQRHARRVGSGSEFSSTQRLAMKRELMALESLSLTDKNALKKIIDSGM
ncbi:hypothetical protein HZA86_03725 [Candidatus Uhrbacteria bacterium]|nr:hypothetical protein [Candidatus Uhrbacteria bacterium]